MKKIIRKSNAKQSLTWLSLASVIILLTATLQAQQLAFPTAEGSGRFATGGRGGSVYEVTNLNNSGLGSIVDAVSTGNRTIVFRVSGIIPLGNVVLNPKSNTTIAGQTAPGDGICIKGRINIGSVSNVVIRYIRVRVDAGGANSTGDAIDIESGTNIIIDHVSASYSRDEGISCQETSNKVTVQWCIISEALTFESHGYGSLVRGEYGDEKTYHHNLYAHNNARNPRPGNYTATSTDPEGLHFDFRNNVVYNWAGSRAGYNADDNSVSRYNFIGNAYIRGTESSGTTVFSESSVDSYGYFEDNSVNGVVPTDPWAYVELDNFSSAQSDAYKSRSAVIPMEPVITTSPAIAKAEVLALVGAISPKRDTIDTRIINDVLDITGHSIATTDDQPEGAWPVLNSLPAPPDDDHDGMSNDWEIENGLSKDDATDRNGIGEGGYTNLEIYLNSLARVTSYFYPPISVAAELAGITKVELSWEDVNDNETGFRIERAEGDAGSFATVAEVEANVTSYTDTVLNELTLYSYRVIAFNDSLTSEYERSVSVTTLGAASLPSTVSNPSPKNNALNISTDTTLMWDASLNANSYAIYFGIDNPPPFVINQVETTFEPGELATGTRYYWRVDGENSNGITEGTVWKFKVEGEIVEGLDVVSKESLPAGNYPNPFYGSTTISYELKNQSDVELKIYNLMGREVASLVNQEQTAGEHSVIFDASDLDSGIYIFRLKTDSFEQRGKMLLMK